MLGDEMNVPLNENEVPKLGTRRAAGESHRLAAMHSHA